MSLMIYKYTIVPELVIALPVDAQPLTVQVQQGTPRLWVLLDPHAPTVPRTFRTFGTGHPVENTGPLHYLATFQLEGGTYVFHTFEDVLPSEGRTL